MVPDPLVHRFDVMPLRRAALSLLLLASLTAEAAAQSRVGTSAAVRGQVFVTSAGAERQAAVREDILLQDRVITKDASALQVLLLDQSTFTVAQNCRITIDRFVYDPDRGAGEVAASVARGAFRYMSGRISKDDPSNARVSTPSATIGIRGTFFEGVVGEDAVVLASLAGIDTSTADRDAASIAILRGPGRGRNSLNRAGSITIGNAAGSAFISQPNYAVFVPGPGEAPIGPFRITPELQDYLDFFLRSAPSGPPVSPLEIDQAANEAGQSKFNDPVDLDTTDLQDVIEDTPSLAGTDPDEGGEDPDAGFEPDGGGTVVVVE